MKLWILEPVHEDREGRVAPRIAEPWQKEPYDSLYGVVVRAEDEAQARQLASEVSGLEGVNSWLDSSLTECTELSTDGEPEVVLMDQRDGRF